MAKRMRFQGSPLSWFNRAGCHRGGRHGCNLGCKKCDENRPHCNGDELRSSWNWLGCEPKPARREYNRVEYPDSRTERQAAPTLDRDCSRARTGGGFVEFLKSKHPPCAGANESGGAIAWH